MMRIVYVLVLWVVAFYKSNWRDWKKYQPTILFMVASSFLVHLLTYSYLLWDLSSELGSHLINDLLLTIFAYPPMVLIYLTNFPFNKKVITKGMYVILWVFIYTVMEAIQYGLENIRYHHGWNLWKSILFDFVLFPMLVIHHVRPLIAYVLFLVGTILFILIYGIPISSFK
ncbi:CBO0543 family protein [Paenibacillus sepulcri]|uniref:Integral membrane protein n=1 Tax=Paenibacillus sepulcri TaxID=359917 RepID=A0ABS7C7A3_9BACL|nr:hypothetical protein [Paenibacillus sepulcri]